MKIDGNMDVQNRIDFGPEKTGKRSVKTNGNGVSVSGAGIAGNDLIAERRKLARKQAMKVVSDAFGGEKKKDAQMQSIMEEIRRLQAEINEKTKSTREIDDEIENLQRQYDIDPDSEENRKLDILSIRMASSETGVTDEEFSKLTDYQQKALYYFTMKGQNKRDIELAKSHLAANIQGYNDFQQERLKSQDMLRAVDAANAIMDASDSEMKSLLTQEAVDHIDEEEKEREEETKKAEEEKKKEKKEAAKKLEKEAIREEITENIKDKVNNDRKTGADVKKAVARRARADAESDDMADNKKTVISDSESIQDTQDAVNSEINNILNKLSLLSGDIKGASVDDQI